LAKEIKYLTFIAGQIWRDLEIFVNIVAAIVKKQLIN